MNIIRTLGIYGLVTAFVFVPVPFLLSSGQVQAQDAQDQQELEKLLKKKSFMEEWFPFLFEEETSPQAGDAMQAPFLDKTGQATTPPSGVEYQPYTAVENSVSLDQPHRQPAQVERWAADRMVDAFNFDPLRYESHLQTLGPFMTPYAQEAFKAFMSKDNLLSALNANDLIMRCFSYDSARMLNQGPVQGRQRWLIDVPVTISFLPRGTSDYTDIKPKSISLIVRMQVGRVESPDYDSMIIETMEINTAAQ